MSNIVLIFLRGVSLGYEAVRQESETLLKRSCNCYIVSTSRYSGMAHSDVGTLK